MFNRNNNSHDSNPPIPIKILQILDFTLNKMIDSGEVEIIHDGSKKYIPFLGSRNEPIDEIESKKYKKSYLVHVGRKMVLLKLIFDNRIGVGYMHVGQQGYELLKEAGIIPSEIGSEN
jgi:hypothetical protein